MAILPGNIERFTFKVIGLDEAFKVVRFEGDEALSSPFTYQLELAVENPEVDFDAIISRPAVLTLYDHSETPVRHVHGHIIEIEQLNQGQSFSIYKVTIVPLLAFLKFRKNCRIFQNKTVPEILQQVMDTAGIPCDQVKVQLQSTYEPREYCVQYRESDLNFFSRVMEQEGIFYFFEHTPDTHVLVISDHVSSHPAIAEPVAVPFHERTGNVADEDSIFAFGYLEQIQPGKAVLRDFNFKKPGLNLQSAYEYKIDVPLEIYDYPGGYGTAEVGNRLSNLQLEVQQVARKQAQGKSSCVRLVSGSRFSLTNHPRADLDQEYLLTRVYSGGEQPQVLEEGASGEGSRYHNRFECIPAMVPYRPSNTARQPTIKGSQTAIVVGPEGEEIYTDEYGRIKVQFHWDRQGQYDEKSSCWIRVSQQWAGAGWGTLFLPRIGQEVIVDFIEGNPDRPVVTGSVYHGTNRPPYPLPEEKTKSTIKSNSSRGGEGYNEIRLDDKKGEEQIYFHAEKDQHRRVKNDAKEWVGHDRHLIIQNDQIELVEGDKHQQVTGDHNIKIDGTLSIEADADTQHKTGANHAHEASQEIHLKAGTKVVLEAGPELTFNVGGNFIKLDASGVTMVGSLVKINEGGSAGSGVGASLNSIVDPLVAGEDESGNVEQSPANDDQYQPTSLDLASEQSAHKETDKSSPQTVASNQAPPSGMTTTPAVMQQETPQGEIHNAMWNRGYASINGEIKLVILVKGFNNGETAQITVLEVDKDGNKIMELDKFNTELERGTGTNAIVWTPIIDETTDILEKVNDSNIWEPQYFSFEVQIAGQKAVSANKIYLIVPVSVTAMTPAGWPLPDGTDFKLVDAFNRTHKTTVKGSLAVFDNVPLGPFKIEHS
jgi:type VI secretion system secreted protein VgrG